MTLRRLALPAVLSLGLLPGLAQALGLGEIKLNSSLYEPLNAEIELVNVRDLESREILPSLAGSAEFKKAGVERYFHLSKMRFSIEERTGGKKVIRVTTKDVITEPFLNFLVEVHWPSGRMLREYTMLLDPPAFARATPAPVAPPLARRELPPVKPAPAPEPPPAAKAPPVRAPVTTPPVTTAKAPAGTQPEEKKTSPVKKNPDTAPAPAPTGVAEAQTYGPVQSSDTLWSIAQRYRPSGANMHQTMLAIQRLNPDAFINNNVNLLKKGKTLRIPSAAEVTELSRSEATAEFQRQEAAWKGRQPTRTVARESTGSAPSAADDSAHLKLVSAPPEEALSGGSASGGVSDASRDTEAALAVSKEQLDKSERRSQELEGHVKQLEDQVQTLERLIELKNSQLAELQAKLDAKGAADTKAPADTGSKAPTLEEQLAAAQAALDDAGDKLDTAMDDAAGGIEDAAGMLKDDAGDAVSGIDSAALDLLSEPETEPSLQEAAPKPEPKPEPKAEPKPKPKPKAAKPKQAAPPPPPEPGLFEDPMVLGGIGGAAVLALVGGMMFLRRRKAAGEDEELDELAMLDESPAPEPVVALDREEPEVEDLAAAVALDEVAEDIGLDVPEPEHKPAATAIEQDLEEEGPSLDDLGMELTADIAGGSATEEVNDLSADLDDLSAELDAELGQAETDADSLGAGLDDLELDLDSGTAGEAASTVEDLEAELGSLDLDTDLESGDLDLDTDLAAATESTADAGLDDFDLSDGAVADAPDAEDLTADLGAELDAELAEAEPAAAGADDDFDLGDLDLEDTAGGDEVATKMDLARAYIDMGDSEGAREILDEVMQEGNDEQKAEAEALIAKL